MLVIYSIWIAVYCHYVICIVEHFLSYQLVMAPGTASILRILGGPEKYFLHFKEYLHTMFCAFTSSFKMYSLNQKEFERFWRFV